MEDQEVTEESLGLMERLSTWLSETPTRWQTMWDANELTVQLFFLVNLAIALYMMSKPFLSGGKDITAVNRTIMICFGMGYALLVVIAYLQLVPTFSPYDL